MVCHIAFTILNFVNMKWLATFVALVFSGLVVAQEASLGVFAGARYTTLELSEAFQYNGQTYALSATPEFMRPQFGAFFKLKAGGVFLQPEVHYVQSAATLHVSSQQPSQHQTMVLHRVDVPVIAGLELLRTIRIYGGLVAGFIQAENWQYNAPFWEDIRIRGREAVWSGQFGVGISIGRFALDGRYERQIGQLYINTNLDGNTYTFRGQQEAIIVQLGFSLFK